MLILNKSNPWALVGFLRSRDESPPNDRARLKGNFSEKTRELNEGKMGKTTSAYAPLIIIHDPFRPKGSFS